MNILLTINESYVKKVAALIHSIKKNVSEQCILYIIYNDISEEGIKRLKNMCAGGDIALREIKFPYSQVLSLPMHGENWSIEVYFRLFAPWLVEEERALYIDGDVIVNGDISELYETELDNCLIAAVANDISEEHNQRLGLPKDNVYVNAGILLMNLELIRKQYTVDEVFQILDSNSGIFKYQDQDFLNHTFYKKIKLVDKKYNYMISVAEVNKEYTEISDIRICHYVMEKPWNIKFPYKTDWLYFKYIPEKGLRKAIKVAYLWSLHRMYRLYQLLCVPKEHRRI